MIPQRNNCLIAKNFEFLISRFWWEDQIKLSLLPNLMFNLSCKPLTIFAKSSTLDVWLGSVHALKLPCIIPYFVLMSTSISMCHSIVKQVLLYTSKCWNKQEHWHKKRFKKLQKNWSTTFRGNMNRVHPLSTYASFCEKLTFLTPWYVLAYVLNGWPKEICLLTIQNLCVQLI